MERVQRTHHRIASGTVVDARASLAMWLRAGRAQRNMSLDDVARVTKIQTRILERLEAGRFDGLPAEVFVRGFVRSFARCVGLDEEEALKRYTACAKAEPPPSASAKALVESMAELAPASASATRTTGGFRATPTIVPTPTPREPIAVGPVEDPMPVPVPMPDLAVDVAPAGRLPRAETIEVVMLPEMGTLTDIPAASGNLEIADVAEAQVELATSTPSALETSVAIAVAVSGVSGAAEEPAKGKRKRSKKRGRRNGTSAPAMATGTPHEALPIVAAPVEEIAPVVEEIAPIVATPVEAVEAAPVAEEIVAAPVEVTPAPHVEEDVLAIGGVWAPKMPPPASAVAPWRIVRGVRRTTVAPVVPSLVIDDNDPESAERELEDRREARGSRARSFLPPILLDREDRSGRQGGLTLAVIILLIAATLTLSYLMRRPSASGDGVTLREAPTSSLRIG